MNNKPHTPHPHPSQALRTYSRTSVNILNFKVRGWVARVAPPNPYLTPI